MRRTFPIALCGLMLLLFVDGCRDSDSAAPDTGDGDDEGGDCPYNCVSQLFCVQASGVGHGEYDCVDQGEICCDLSGGPDGDSDSDSDGDTETDTGEEPCPFECMTEYLCNATGGEEHEGYACEEAGDVCCEDDGYKGPAWKCLICEPDHQPPPAAEPGAGVLDFLWKMVSGN